jgi:hypothetical protein
MMVDALHGVLQVTGELQDGWNPFDSKAVCEIVLPHSVDLTGLGGLFSGIHMLTASTGGHYI